MMTQCAFCREQVTYDGMGAWIDATGGDVCSGDDSLANENEPHVALFTSMQELAEWQREAWHDEV